MKYLLSNNPLTINDGIASQINVIVKGTVQMETINWEVGADISMQFQYLDDATQNICHAGTIIIDAATQQALYQAVKANLPNIDTDFAAWYEALIYEAFRVEMATTFGIPTTDITIVTV